VNDLTLFFPFPMDIAESLFRRRFLEAAAPEGTTTFGDGATGTTTLAPMANEGNITDAVFEKAEEEHEYDAVETLLLNLCLICCLMLAYYVKRFRIYSFPESTGALFLGAVIGGGARLYTDTDNLSLFEFVSADRWAHSRTCLSLDYLLHSSVEYLESHCSECNGRPLILFAFSFSGCCFSWSLASVT
jgi:hypothetical protein